MDKPIFKLFYSHLLVGLILAIMILLAGCGYGLTGKAITSIPHESAIIPEVYFCPKIDCSKVLEKLIISANDSVHCAFYDLDLKNIISALSRKSKIDEVKLVMDNSNYEHQVEGGGIRLDRDNHLMHNKFCIFDYSKVFTGSFNPTYNDNNLNNNNIVVIYSNNLAKNYEDEFNELWNSNFGKGNKVLYPLLYINSIKIESYFCPDDQCASHIIDLIKNAQHSIYFMSFSFTNEEIADALIRKKDLDIRGILDSGQSSSKFSQLKILKEHGINAQKDAGKYKMHHKVFIIDNATVATGSFNPTLSADTNNDENLIILHDKRIAALFLKEFDSLWN